MIFMSDGYVELTIPAPVPEWCQGTGVITDAAAIYRIGHMRGAWDRGRQGKEKGVPGKILGK